MTTTSTAMVLQPTRLQRYAGSVESPIPPAPAGWTTCPHADEPARLLADAFTSLGDEFPSYHFTDTYTPAGLYRHYAYEAPSGQRVMGALRYVGENAAPPETREADALGDAPPGGLPGSTAMPVPVNDSICTWLPTTQNADGSAATKAVTIANAIAYGQWNGVPAPTPWIDQGSYAQTIDGVRWTFTMFHGTDTDANGNQYVGKNVVSWRCTPTPPGQVNPPPGNPNNNPPALSSSSSAAWIIIGGILIVIGAAAGAKYLSTRAA